ncbi:hypothetical protein H8356DRAFT_958097 [Neocallimastix lanati (nom. inval.)]|uniref:Rho-GAP domain-containing protein n=1 Tax=Neocallimastix californiae TaxID=1754190 RepID=A0A1Y2CRR0_9FUNG|nr:hypothetical protein H8356DRAFT_958097 [Neocallimastix sp. JGI-2020a]ORY49657.1 hypothetical protein LY90DRAFT_508618 [Neocallimastix californiae]|eukprot:ORY49657.1 hypothetical protein LY90DRAFT_508618 [Neocallimastix californiae]
MYYMYLIAGKIDFTNYSDVHAIATLFKQFLRELSGKIIPKNLFTLFESAKDSDDKIREALSQLPKQRYDTLLYILEFIFYIDKYKKYNKMDIENLCIVFAPNIIECLETADMHTTLIAPLHIINSIIRYFEKIRMKREEDELKLSYFDIKPVYDEENNSEENSVKDIVFRGYDYDIVSLEDIEFFLGNDDEKTLSCNNDEKTLLCNNDEKTLPDNNDEKASSDNNKDNHSDRVIKEVVESLDFLDSSTIDIKYCNDIISLEDSTIGTSINLNTSISRNMSTDINSNSNLISNFNDAPSVLLKPNKYKKYLDDKNALKENYENKIFELVDQNNRLDSSVTILNDNKFIEIDCSNITQYPIPNNYLSKEETLINLDDKRDDPENYNISNSYNPNLNENKNNNYYITLLSNFDNLKKKYNNSCNIISSIRNKNTNDDKRNSHVEKNNSNKYNKNKPIIDSIRYISGELISSNSVNNIYSSNSIEMNNKNKYNLLETMKVKDIMNLNSEEKAKITRNFSVNESLLINKEKLCQKQKGKLPNLSQQIIDIEPYTLNSRNSGVDGNKEEIIKGLKDFNTQLKNVTKTQSMNSTQHQQQKLFIERLRDLEHYIKFLDRYIKELKEFSKREDEDTEVIKEMERFTRKKFKLLRLYIKVYYPFIDLQSWMKKNESEDALSKHKDLKLENVCFYYGIKDLSPGQRIIRNIDKRRQLERRSIYVFAMKPGEIMKTYKEIKRELSTLKSFYANFKSDSTIEKEKLEEYRMIDKIILKELFWYINRLKMSIEKVKDKDKEKRNSLKKIDNPFERCMFNACKNEKKKLQEELITYQENFYKKNGRPIKTKNDLKPIEAQYKRYKELKTYLKSFSVISE